MISIELRMSGLRDRSLKFQDHPPAADTFTLARLEAISGVKAATILRWQDRKAICVPPVGAGKPRMYSLWDAMHVAVVAEMTILRLQITGSGQDLSLSLTRYIRTHLIKNGHTDELRSVALWWDGGALKMSQDADADRPGSYIVIGLPQVAKGVL